MEGARHTPWLWMTAAADPGFPLLDCTACRRYRDVEERQEMGCGYEARLPAEQQVALWVHEGFPVRLVVDDAGQERLVGRPTVCVGYTSKLPEVLAIAALAPHWERGTLKDKLRGAVTPPLVFAVLEEIEAHRNAAEAWRMRDRDQRARAERGG